MKNDTILLIGAGVAAYFIIDGLSRNTASSTIGQGVGYSIGETVGNTAINAPIGLLEGLWNSGYNWGYNSYAFSPQMFKDIFNATYGKLFGQV